MTKTAFLAALRVNLVAAYPWAADATKLDRFMANTATTLDTTSNLTSIDGPAFVDAWHSIGGKGKPTFKALRALAA